MQGDNLDQKRREEQYKLLANVFNAVAVACFIGPTVGQLFRAGPSISIGIAMGTFLMGIALHAIAQRLVWLAY